MAWSEKKLEERQVRKGREGICEFLLASRNN